jgi:hypothetical protein
MAMFDEIGAPCPIMPAPTIHLHTCLLPAPKGPARKLEFHIMALHKNFINGEWPRRGARENINPSDPTC